MSTFRDDMSPAILGRGPESVRPPAERLESDSTDL
jgi:hypothetical protein